MLIYLFIIIIISETILRGIKCSQSLVNMQQGLIIMALAFNRSDKDGAKFAVQAGHVTGAWTLVC